jgi:hypothetical protein
MGYMDAYDREMLGVDTIPSEDVEDYTPSGIPCNHTKPPTTEAQRGAQ